MLDLPFVSIIVPAFNEADRLVFCLKKLLDQDYPRERREIIVINNASTDRTASIIAKYPVIGLREPRKGSYIARNRGILRARGEIVAFIDADCIPKSSSWIRSLISGYLDPAIGAFVGEFQPLSTNRIIERYVHYKRLICQDKLLTGKPPSAAAGNVAFRREVFEKIGLFQEHNHFGADSEFILRMIRNCRFQLRYNPKAIVFHPHPTSPAGLFRRTYHLGMGLAWVRLAHPGAFSSNQLSVSFYRKMAFKTFLGFCKYPLALVHLRRLGKPWSESLTYPLLDKGHSLALIFGLYRGLKGA